MNPRTDNKNTFLDLIQQFPFVVLFVLGIIVFANAIFHPFVHDDIVFIQQNPALLEFNLHDIFFRTAKFTEINNPIINTYYRPVLDVVYRLQFRVFGLFAPWYHLFNILLHIINACLVYLILGRLFKLSGDEIVKNQSNLILLGSAVFLIHPVQSEAVDCVVGISNLLFVFFILTAFYFYFLYREDGRLWILVGLLGLFALALFTKEQAIILPVMILLAEIVWKGFKANSIKALFGCLIILISYFMFRRWVLGLNLHSMISINGEFWLRIKAIPGTLLMYLGTVVWPIDLHYYRSYDILRPWILDAIVVIVILIMVGLIVSRMTGPSKRLALFGLGFFIVSLLPVLNFVPLVNEYSFILTSEHFLYLPIIGLIIFVFAILETLRNIQRTGIFYLVLIAGLSLMTIQQNTFWRGEVPLFERMILYEPNFGRGRILLARAYWGEGQIEKALEQYQIAHQIMTRYFQIAKGEMPKAVYKQFLEQIESEITYLKAQKESSQIRD